MSTGKNRNSACKASFLKKKMEEERRLALEAETALQEIVQLARKKKNTDQLRFTQKMIKQFRKDRTKSLQEVAKNHENVYCNVGCKNTILEAGGKGSFPAALTRRYKTKQPAFLDSLRERRTQLFGDKRDVLDDSFYENTPPELVQSLKRDGAVSFCSPHAVYAVHKKKPSTRRRRRPKT